MRRLIVTADDFGLSEDVNAAVQQAHTRGILNTTSLMVAAPAAAQAIRIARRLPRLRVGLHVVVTHGHAVLDRAQIPALLGRAGGLSNRLVASGTRWFFRPAVRRQLGAEIRAQFEAFRSTGLDLDHVNAHKHQHLHPTVLTLILEIGREYGMRSVRLPYEPFWPSWRAARRGAVGRCVTGVLLAPWVRMMRRRLRRHGLSCNDQVFGMYDSGSMSPALLLRFLAELPRGVTEIYFHPVAGATRLGHAGNQELDALTDPVVRERLERSDIERVTFADLAAAGQ